MTPRDLLAAFETLADAPAGVDRLRQLITDMAVLGQLLPERSEGKSAVELLKEIAAFRDELVRRKEVRKPRKLPALGHDGPDLPADWVWCRLGDLALSFQNGTSKRRGNGPPVVVLRLADITRQRIDDSNPRKIGLSADDASKYAVHAGDLLVIRVNGSTDLVGRFIPVLDSRGYTYCDHLIRLQLPSDHISSRYVALYADSGVARRHLSSVTVTTAGQNTINQTGLGTLPVPLPPLSEQHRIVARVDELMGLLDRLEAARTQREELRQKTRDAALAALREAEDAEEVEAAWGRIARDMDDLFTTPEDVGPLRQAILELAVRGRLVEQDPGDEPASTLLGDRILKDRPSTVPAGWEHSTFKLLGKIMGGGTPSKRNPRFWGGDIPWVSPKDMKRDLIGESQDYVTVEAVEGSSIKLIPANSLLMVVRGMILAHSFPTALTTAEVTVNQDMKAVVPFDAAISPYLLLVSKGIKRSVLELVKQSTHGTCKLTSDDIFNFSIPVPPLDEQARIVTKVDALMSLCDDLEARLTSARDLQGQFAAAAVHHLDV